MSESRLSRWVSPSPSRFEYDRFPWRSRSSKPSRQRKPSPQRKPSSPWRPVEKPKEDLGSAKSKLKKTRFGEEKENETKIEKPKVPEVKLKKSERTHDGPEPYKYEIPKVNLKKIEVKAYVPEKLTLEKVQLKHVENDAPLDEETEPSSEALIDSTDTAQKVINNLDQVKETPSSSTSQSRKPKETSKFAEDESSSKLEIGEEVEWRKKPIGKSAEATDASIRISRPKKSHKTPTSKVESPPAEDKQEQCVFEDLQNVERFTSENSTESAPWRKGTSESHPKKEIPEVDELEQDTTNENGAVITKRSSKHPKKKMTKTAHFHEDALNKVQYTVDDSPAFIDSKSLHKQPDSKGISWRKGKRTSSEEKLKVAIPETDIINNEEVSDDSEIPFTSEQSEVSENDYPSLDNDEELQIDFPEDKKKKETSKRDKKSAMRTYLPDDDEPHLILKPVKRRSKSKEDDAETVSLKPVKRKGKKPDPEEDKIQLKPVKRRSREPKPKPEAVFLKPVKKSQKPKEPDDFPEDQLKPLKPMEDRALKQRSKPDLEKIKRALRKAKEVLEEAPYEEEKELESEDLPEKQYLSIETAEDSTDLKSDVIPHPELIDEPIKVIKKKKKPTKKKPKVKALKRIDSQPKNIDMIPPSFETLLEDEVFTTSEAPAVLSCSVKGFPQPSVRWFFNTEEVVETDNLTTSYSQSFATLTIQKTGPQSVGLYTLEAVNPVGKATTVTCLQIEGNEECLLNDFCREFLFAPH